MAYIVMASLAEWYLDMEGKLVMTYVAMAYIVMAYIVMVYIVMA